MTKTIDMDHLPKLVQKWILEQKEPFAIIVTIETPLLQPSSLDPLKFIDITNDPMEVEAVRKMYRMVENHKPERIQEVMKMLEEPKIPD